MHCCLLALFRGGTVLLSSFEAPVLRWVFRQIFLIRPLKKTPMILLNPCMLSVLVLKRDP